MAMARGKQSSFWEPASLIACLIANTNRDPSRRRRPFTPEEFNPFAQKRERPIKQGMPLTVGNLMALKPLVQAGLFGRK